MSTIFTSWKIMIREKNNFLREKKNLFSPWILPTVQSCTHKIIHISITFQIDIIGHLFHFILLKLAYYLLAEAAAVVFSHIKKRYWLIVETMLLFISLCSRFAIQIFVVMWCKLRYYYKQHELLLPMKMQKHLRAH